MSYHYNELDGGLLNTDIYLDKKIIPDLTKNYVEIEKEIYDEILKQNLTLVKKNNKFIIQNNIKTINKEKNITIFCGKIYYLIGEKSKSLGYTSEENILSFLSSSEETWKNEAILFNEWRDNTLKIMYNYIKRYMDDEIDELPPIEKFVSSTDYFDVKITSPSRPTLS